MPDFRETSKKHFAIAGANPTHEEIQAGCLQRIADATELMARRYTDLIDERNRFRGYMETARVERDAAVRTANTLKGHVTRLRDRVRTLEQESPK